MLKVNQIILFLLFSTNIYACPFDIEVTCLSNEKSNINQLIEEGDQFLISSCNGERQEFAEVKYDLKIILSQGTEFDGNTMTKNEVKEKIKNISLILITNDGVRVKPN